MEIYEASVDEGSHSYINLGNLLSVMDMDNASECLGSIMIPVVRGRNKEIDYLIDLDVDYIIDKIEMCHPDYDSVNPMLDIDFLHRIVKFYAEVKSKEITNGISERDTQEAVDRALCLFLDFHKDMNFTDAGDREYICREFFKYMELEEYADTCESGCEQDGTWGRLEFRLDDGEWEALGLFVNKNMQDD